jgi:hypothetical protein
MVMSFLHDGDGVDLNEPGVLDRLARGIN